MKLLNFLLLYQRVSCHDFLQRCFTFLFISFCSLRHNYSTPLVYSSLTTRRSSYPTWILLNSIPIPAPIKRRDIGNATCEALLSSHHAVQVPPTVNDIAEALPWILWEAPHPVVCAYPAFAKNLYRVCMINNHHIHPYEAHFILTMTVAANILKAYLWEQGGLALPWGSWNVI